MLRLERHHAELLLHNLRHRPTHRHHRHIKHRPSPTQLPPTLSVPSPALSVPVAADQSTDPALIYQAPLALALQRRHPCLPRRPPLNRTAMAAEDAPLFAFGVIADAQYADLPNGNTEGRQQASVAMLQSLQHDRICCGLPPHLPMHSSTRTALLPLAAAIPGGARQAAAGAASAASTRAAPGCGAPPGRCELGRVRRRFGMATVPTGCGQWCIQCSEGSGKLPHVPMVCMPCQSHIPPPHTRPAADCEWQPGGAGALRSGV